MRKHIIIFLILLVFIETLLRLDLFKRVSYSNSLSVDQQLAQLQNSESWDLIFIGDSEVHWGVVPKVIDNVLNQNGVQIKSFNMAMDGFGASWWSILLPKLLKNPSLAGSKYVVLGVQLTDKLEFFDAKSKVSCGALQKPILISPFGIDHDLDSICKSGKIDKFKSLISHPLWMTRYSSSVRSYILPEFMVSSSIIAFNSRKSGPTENGFEPHKSIREESATYEDEFKRWKAQYDPKRDFVPLNPQAWQNMASNGGYFDKLNQLVLSHNKKLILFALPTNPVTIDVFNRRDDYNKNSRLLKQWAYENHVGYIDLGIQDVVNPEDYFSDMRHLSEFGAEQFSKELASFLQASL